jgi:hypothetical protein
MLGKNIMVAKQVEKESQIRREKRKGPGTFRGTPPVTHFLQLGPTS